MFRYNVSSLPMKRSAKNPHQSFQEIGRCVGTSRSYRCNRVQERKFLRFAKQEQTSSGIPSIVALRFLPLNRMCYFRNLSARIKRNGSVLLYRCRCEVSQSSCNAIYFRNFLLTKIFLTNELAAQIAFESRLRQISVQEMYLYLDGYSEGGRVASSRDNSNSFATSKILTNEVAFGATLFTLLHNVTAPPTDIDVR